VHSIQTPPKGWDARAVANCLLDTAHEQGIHLTNLSLQKLLYFSHAHFLVTYRKKLASGFFEAWKYGPVHPLVYDAFKHEGRGFITSRAQKFNFVERAYEEIPAISDRSALVAAHVVLDRFGGMTAGQLVALSHAKEGPWSKVVDRAKNDVALGLRISDDDTIAFYGGLKVSSRVLDEASEPYEDIRLTAY
jgi:uncharacterized phage-associated protein